MEALIVIGLLIACIALDNLVVTPMRRTRELFPLRSGLSEDIAKARAKYPKETRFATLAENCGIAKLLDAEQIAAARVQFNNDLDEVERYTRQNAENLKTLGDEHDRLGVSIAAITEYNEKFISEYLKERREKAKKILDSAKENTLTAAKLNNELIVLRSMLKADAAIIDTLEVVATLATNCARAVVDLSAHKPEAAAMLLRRRQELDESIVSSGHVMAKEFSTSAIAAYKTLNDCAQWHLAPVLAYNEKHRAWTAAVQQVAALQEQLLASTVDLARVSSHPDAASTLFSCDLAARQIRSVKEVLRTGLKPFATTSDIRVQS